MKLLKGLYQFSAFAYGFGIRIASIWSKKARAWIRLRKDWETKLAARISKHDSWIWCHCSSIGEFNDFQVLLELLSKRIKPTKLLLTFYSPTGLKSKRAAELADEVFFLPLDTRRNAKHFLDLVNPDFAVFSRAELWMNVITEMKHRVIPHFLVGFRMDKRNGLTKGIQSYLYGHCLKCFTTIYASDESSKEVLRDSFQCEYSEIYGNPRVDSILARKNENELQEMRDFVGTEKCIVVGSSHTMEHKFIAEILKKNSFPNVKWIVVPHEPEPKTIAHLMDLLPNSAVVSTLNNGQAGIVLIINAVGILQDLYSLADLAIVGGGFIRKGIHNVIEPVSKGVPVLVGPNTRGFKEVAYFKERDWLDIFKNRKELEEKILLYLQADFSNESEKMKEELLRISGVSIRIAEDILKSVASH